MSDSERSAKRQRVLYSPRDSSPDELADFDDDHVFSSARRRTVRRPTSPRLRRASAVRERRRSANSLSTDELAGSENEEHFSSRRTRRVSGSSQGTPTRTPRQDSPLDRDRSIGIDGADDMREQSQPEEERYGRNGEDESDVNMEHQDISMSATPAAMLDIETRSPSRSETPLPPPPPPRPTKVDYKIKYVLRGHKAGIAQARISPDGTMIASCSADATIKVWSVRTGTLLQTFTGHLAGVSTIDWSHDSTILATGSDDKSIRLWNVLTGQAHPPPYVGHSNYVYSLAFTPKGNILVSGSYDEAVFIWETRTGRVIRKLPAHSDPVGGVDVVRDGTLVVSCSSDGLIRIWDTVTGQCLATMHSEDKPPCSSVKFSPNGKFVLAWSNDDSIRLWNYNEGRCVKTYQGHVNLKYSIGGGFGTYGADGRYAFVVSGSEDNTVVLWDVVSKEILGRLEGHDDVVLHAEAMRRAEDGVGMIVSCGLDKTIIVWEEVVEKEEESVEEQLRSQLEGASGANNQEAGSELGQETPMIDGSPIPSEKVNGVETPLEQVKQEDSDFAMDEA